VTPHHDTGPAWALSAGGDETMRLAEERGALVSTTAPTSTPGIPEAAG
jgi:hypothetical protein